MACMSCGGKTLAPKKPQLAAAIVRPASAPISMAKLTFGKPKINRGK